MLQLKPQACKMFHEYERKFLRCKHHMFRECKRLRNGECSNYLDGMGDRVASEYGDGSINAPMRFAVTKIELYAYAADGSSVVERSFHLFSFKCWYMLMFTSYFTASSLTIYSFVGKKQSLAIMTTHFFIVGILLPLWFTDKKMYYMLLHHRCSSYIS